MNNQVKHKNGFKRIWNIPREVRTSRPALYRGFLEVIFSDDKYSILLDKDIQRDFNKKLCDVGLKRRVKNRDPNPGGVRTLLSQLEGLCLIFRDKDTKILYPTLAGVELMRGDALKAMRMMILKYQFPNSGNYKPNIKLNPGIKVRPYLLVLKLLNDKDIKFLSVEELFIPILFGHNDKCLDYCKEKIANMRKGSNWFDVIDKPSEVLYTVNKKFKNEDKSTRIESWYKYLSEISTTIIPLLRDVQLVEDKKDEKGIRYIHLPENINDDFKKYLNNKNQILPYNENLYEHFQRKIGVIDISDRRELTKEKTFNRQPLKSAQIKTYFLLKNAREEIHDEISDALLRKICDEFSTDKNTVRKILEKCLDIAYDEFEQNLIICSQSGVAKSKEFEKLVAELFRKRFQFYVEETGSLKRKSGGHNYGDLYIVDKKKKNVIIGDAKSIKEYSLPVGDRDKMESYISSINDLNQKFFSNDDLKLVLCIFIASSISRTFNDNAINFYKRITPVKIAGIGIRELIELSKTKNIGRRQEELVKRFQVNGTLNRDILN